MKKRDSRQVNAFLTSAFAHATPTFEFTFIARGSIYKTAKRCHKNLRNSSGFVMVRVNTFDSKDEGGDNKKRNDLEKEEPMADSSDESSKAKTAESYRVLSQAAVTGIIITIGIGLFTVSAVIFWIWKRQMGNIKNESSEDDGDQKPDSYAEKNEQRKDHVSAAHDKNQNGSTRKPTVLDKDPTKENTSQSLLSQHNFEHFSNCNSLPEQLERVTQLASAVRPEETEIVLLQAIPNYTGNPPTNSAVENIDIHTTSTKGTERLKLCNKENKIDDKSQNNVALQVCGSEHTTTSSGVNINYKDSTESSRDHNVDDVRELEPVSHSLRYLTDLHKPKETVDGSMISKLPNDMFMFPQDNHVMTSEPHPESFVKSASQTITNHKQRNSKQQLALSKSLDLHRSSLEKGCLLLTTKPAKSSLRRCGSEESLKKYVHFPEEIRSIRKVYKYDSLDDIIFLKTDADQLEEKTKN